MSQQRRIRGGIGITKRGNKYEATYNIPKNELPEGSPRVRITAQGDSEREAQRKLLAKIRAREEELTPKITPIHATITLGEWLDEWLEDYVRYNVQESTLQIYIGHIEHHIKPYIGHLNLETMSSREVKVLWWDKLQSLKKTVNGEPTDQPLLGTSALTNVARTLRMALNAASDKYDIKNRFTGNLFKLKRPTQPESTTEITEAVQRIIHVFYRDLDRDDPRWAQFMPALLGLRQAERLGLELQSVVVDGKNPTLLIYNQLAFLKSQGGQYLKNATKNGHPREVPLFGEFLDAIKIQLERRQQLSEQPDWNPDPRFKDLLFLQPGGKLLTRKKDNEDWHSLDLDLRGHVLRHAAAQILADQQVSKATAKVILGHKSDVLHAYYGRLSTIKARREMEKKFRPGEILEDD